MSALGSPSITSRSADLPASSVPVTSSTRSILAPFFVAQVIANSGENPTFSTKE